MHALAVACVGVYLGWLGWHAPYFENPDTGRTEGPYTSSQVLGLALSVVLVVAIGCFFTKRPRAIVNTATGALLLTYFAEAGTRPTEDANMWLVGAILYAPVLWLVAFLCAAGLEKRHQRRHPAEPVPHTAAPVERFDADAAIASWRRYRDRSIN